MNTPTYVGFLSHYEVTNPRSHIVQTVSSSTAYVSQLNPLAFDETLWETAKVFYVLGRDHSDPLINDTEQSCVVKHIRVTTAITLPPGAEVIFATIEKATGRYPFAVEEKILDYVCSEEAQRTFRHQPSNYIPGSGIYPSDNLKYYIKSVNAGRVRHRNLTARDISIFLFDVVKSTDFLPALSFQLPDGV